MSADPALGMAHSYYAATATPCSSILHSGGEREADLCVIGGGLTGLSTALSAAERGLSVILLEAERIGWGASGRSGGQLIPGWRKGAAELVKRYGEQDARALFALSREARDLVLARIAKHNIACDLRTNGHLLAAARPSDLIWMQEEAEALRTVMDYQHVRVLSRDEARNKVASPLLHGALLDAGGGHFHPLHYTIGLARAACAAGVQVFEHEPAMSIAQRDNIEVRTARGVVRARHVALACDALLGGLEPRIAGHIMPVASYQIATAPLANPAALIADDLAVSDTRFVVNYFRLSADRRLIFGGGERYARRPPDDIAAFVRPFMLRVFPQLADVPIDYAWGGLVSITVTRLPHVGRMGELFFAHGYSGQGLLLTAIAGEAIADAITSSTKRFESLAGLAAPEFPGGSALRAPLHVLGMLYYALRDRLAF
ncbi:MAG TPA: FAD-binding oxidoreductase [Caulobacterales bacterium]|nr:FAD-binding oxidoreductase [Caulobacterales bacterium]